MEINTTDQDEIEILKKWWKENGTSLVTGLVVGLTILFGWRGWNEYVDSQGMAASQYFEQMQNAIIQQQAEKAEGVGNQLIDQYPGTVYATNAALALAALSVESNDGAFLLLLLVCIKPGSEYSPIKEALAFDPILETSVNSNAS